MSLILCAALAGCQEEIVTGPSAADFESERVRLAEANQKRQAREAKTATAVQGGEAAEGEGSQGAFAAVGANYIYDPMDKRDPFRSFRFDDGDPDDVVRGPLEQFELGQLAVVAVIWETNKPRALVESPEGSSYIVREGSRIGKNEGRVIHIGDNLVLVKETYVDFAGEQTTKDVELRIRRSQGG